jgi:CheY-like chemotaxis protein
MADILLIDERRVLELFERPLQTVGYSFCSATSGSEALAVLAERNVDLIVVDLELLDISGRDVIRHVRRVGLQIPIVVVTGTGNSPDGIAAMQLGAVNFLKKPADLNLLLRTAPVLRSDDEWPNNDQVTPSSDHEAHAAVRWARAVVPLLNAPKDPRTIAGWADIVFVSPGALRNWCYTAGIAPRRALVFGRLLRAAHLFRHRGQHLENLLDVVDRRTLVGLLRTAGVTLADFPMAAEEFVERQSLVRDDATLMQVRCALEEYRRRRHSRAG